MTASLSLFMSVVDLVSLAVRTVPVLSDLSVADMRVDALKAALETSYKHTRALESHAASQDADIVWKVDQVDSSEGCP